MQDRILAAARGDSVAHRHHSAPRAGWAPRVLAGLVAPAPPAPPAGRGGGLAGVAPGGARPKAFPARAGFPPLPQPGGANGPRPPGTEREAEAANYLAGELRR